MNRLVAQLGVRVESPEWSILTKDGNIEHCAYPDMHYYNSRKLGISYQVKPTGTYASRIVSIDIYNGQPRWGTYPDYPILLNYNTTNGTRGLSIEPHTTALDFVLALGEPTRKGGGEAGGATARALGPAAVDGMDTNNFLYTALFDGRISRRKRPCTRPLGAWPRLLCHVGHHHTLHPPTADIASLQPTRPICCTYLNSNFDTIHNAILKC